MSVQSQIAPPQEVSTNGPLTAAHRRELELAHGRAKVIRRAAGVAAFNGWTMAILAVLSIPFAFGSVSGALATVALSVVTLQEFRGRKRLLRFEPSAATLLGWNQVALLVTICFYCMWSLYTSLNSANSISAELEAYSNLDSSLGSLQGIDTLARQVTIVLYGTVIALSCGFQGLNAVYYFTRRKHIESYVADTPAWVRELQLVTMPA